MITCRKCQGPIGQIDKKGTIGCMWCDGIKGNPKHFGFLTLAEVIVLILVLSAFFMFFAISGLQRIERMQKQIVADVLHEQQEAIAGQIEFEAEKVITKKERVRCMADPLKCIGGVK